MKHQQTQTTGARNSLQSTWSYSVSDGTEIKERIYLERAFGHGSRHRLTRFERFSAAYLKRLRDLPPGSDPQQTSVPLRRSDLLQQSDEILRRLEWHQEKAIEFLKQNFQATSRQQLSDEQLLTFNMLLEEQLVASPGQ